MIRVNKEFLSYITKLNQAERAGSIMELCVGPVEKIIEQKTNVLSVYIIKSGIAKCYLTEDTGKDFIQEFFGEGEIFGEIEMFNNDLSFCTIEAITDMVLYKIPKAHFYELLEKDKKFNLMILQGLAAKISYTALRSSYQQSHSIEYNLLDLKKFFPEMTQLISKRDLANYLGITERSLNRSLNNLKERF